MTATAERNHASKKNTEQPLVPEPQHTGRNSESFVSAGGMNKMAISRKIFNEIGTKEPRKNVIARMKDEANLSDAAAATYYQNLKKEAGLVAVGGSGNTRAQNNPPEKDGGAATARK